LFTDAYWRALAKFDGDELKATDWFIKQFGFNPVALTTSASQELVPTSYTEEGLFFANANKEVFERNPNVAYWLFPDAPTDEFYLSAYQNSFATGARKARNLDEYYEEGYKTALFNLAKENLRRQLYDNPGLNLTDAARNNMFKMGVIELADEYDMQEYPSLSRITVQTQFEELEKMLEVEKDTVVNLPDGVKVKVKELPIYRALQTYLQQRKIILGGLQFRTKNPTASLSRADARAERELLETLADKLIRISPDFYFWYYNVGRTEFKDVDTQVTPIFDGFEI